MLIVDEGRDRASVAAGRALVAGGWTVGVGGPVDGLAVVVKPTTQVMRAVAQVFEDREAALDPRALARIQLFGALDDDPGVLIAEPHGRGRAVLEDTLARIARAVENAESRP